MSVYEFAKFSVRFSAAFAIFYAAHEATYFPAAYRIWKTIYDTPEEKVIATQDFGALLFRISLQLLVAVVLFGRTEQVISLLTRGIWAKQSPNKAPEPTPGAVTPRATEGDSK